MIKKISIIAILIFACFSFVGCKKTEVTSISVNEDSVLIFYENEFKIDKIKIDVVYVTGDISVISLTNEMVLDGLDSINQSGQHQLTVSYKNKTCQVNVLIEEKLFVDSINYDKNSTNTFEKNKFDISKIYIDVTYSNTTIKRVALKEENIVDGLNSLNEVGKHTLGISYEGKNLSIDVTITNPSSDFVFNKINGGYSITEYSGIDEVVYIPIQYNNLPVVEIGTQAFLKNNNVKKVVIPNTVTKICEAAFYQMTNLNTVVVPSSVTSVEKYGLGSAKIIYMESMKEGSNWAQDWHDTLHSCIQYGTDVDTIVKDGDFEYFIKDDKVVLSNYYGNSSVVVTPTTFNGKKVEIIGAACFRGNNNITSITISDGIKIIETYGLAETENLINITLANSIEVLGEYSLRGCINLENIILPTSLKHIEYAAFNMCSKLKEMIIPSGVESIGGYAFAWCVCLTKIYIPNSVTVIKGGACYACSSASIFCEGSTELSTWESGWNMSSRPIYWNQTL